MSRRRNNLISLLVRNSGRIFSLLFFYFCFTGHAVAEFTTILNVPPDTAPRFLESDTQLNVYGSGVIGKLGWSDDNIEVNIFDGVVSGDVSAAAVPAANSVLNVAGGKITGAIFLFSNGNAITIRGGQFSGRGLFAFRGHANLLGTQFAIDGIPISGLDVGTPMVISDRREVRLTATLSDGSQFEQLLGSACVGRGCPEGYISEHATLTVTLVPEPCVPLILLAGSILAQAGRLRQTYC